MDAGSEQLRTLVDRFERFLIEQINRLEDTLNAVETRATAAAGVSLTQEFAEQRQRWEAERARERARLESEAARLIEAWQRVEAEERRLVAAGRGRSRSDLIGHDRPAAVELPRSSARRSEADSVGPEPLVIEADRRESELSACLSAPPVYSQHVSVSDEPLSAELAALQFQQMRREMQRHRCRS